MCDDLGFALDRKGARGADVQAELLGVVIPEGAQAALLIGAGNHDPRHYEDPATFDLIELSLHG
ncbi:MAG: hypothetical protein L0G69_11905 [Brevibacterium sp.]|nr:hypothetical protein [Brevibacterium sp.]MDN5605592.1 hypothetical protein [Kocuria sp.]